MQYDLVIRGNAVYQKGDELTFGRVNIGISQGKIGEISHEHLEGKITLVLKENQVLVPGFYGTHSHGGGNLIAPAVGGYNQARDDFVFDPAKVEDYLWQTMRAHLAFGTMGLNISAMAVPIETQLIPFLRATARIYGSRDRSALYRGADLESNFFAIHNPKGEIKGRPIINNPNLGAQPKEHLVVPSIELYKRLRDASEDHIRRVCVGMDWDGAKEYRESRPALALVRHLVQERKVIGFGHTYANYRLIEPAIIQGGRYVGVHMTNGQSTMLAKNEMFTFIESLGDLLEIADERGALFYGEVITDYKHVDPRAAVWVRYMFGPDRVILVDDNMGFTGTELPVPRVNFAGTYAVLSDDKKVFVVDDGLGTTYCGSKSTMWDGFSNYIHMLMLADEDGRGPIIMKTRMRHNPLDFEHAIIEASKAASKNPADLYGERDIGTIVQGKRADLLVVGRLGNSLTLDKVIMDGLEIAA